MGNACTLTIGISILLTVLAEANLELFFRLFKVQEEIIGMTRDYFSIALLGIPFVLIYNVAAALLRADGNSKITFYAVASATVINIVLDLLFIAGFGWGVAGGGAGHRDSPGGLHADRSGPPYKKSYVYSRPVLLETGKEAHEADSPAYGCLCL